MKYDVVTIGDSFEDIYVVPEDMKVKQDRSYPSGQGVSFELGEKIILEDLDYEVGGSACNVGVALSRLGLNASVISVLGNDATAGKIKNRLLVEKVNADNLIYNNKMKTNFSVIFRIADARTIFVYHGLKEYNCLRIKKTIDSSWIFLAPVGANAENLEDDIVRCVSEKGSKLAWNPGSIQIKLGASKYRNLLKNTSVLILNREEAIKFTDYPVRPTSEDVLKRLFSFGPKIVVMTNGKSGAMAYDGRGFYKVEILPNAENVEPTGAGDSFGASFVARLAIADWTEKMDEEVSQALIGDALRWGVFNSASVIRYVGAQKGLLTRSEMENQSKRYNSFRTKVERS